MANKQVRVTICGTGYTLSTDDAEEYVLGVADRVEKSMKAMMNENDRISTLMAAVITALNNADDAAKATVSADNLRAQIKDFIEENAKLRQEADSANRECERLRRELMDMRSSRS